ncbi:MAG: hypothetical protein NTW03_03425, partial [Verrucomicrobia bacterium]|nr:hypothetical protein [Verrucomicrobiota bacterium]
YLPSPLVYDTPLAGWTHVAVVYENKTPSLFLNGTLVRTGLTSQRSFVYPSQTFGDVLGYGYYAGRLDEVMIFNRALGSNELTALATAGLTGLCRTNANCIPPPAGLVSWWPGDRDAGDLAGTNSGRLINTASLAPGLVGNAFSFDGSSAVVDLGNSPSLHVSAGDFTAAAWITFNQLSGDQSILDKMTTCAAPNCDGWRLFKQQDGAFWFCLGGGSSNGCDANGPNTLRSATLPQAGVWYHVAAVKSASSFSIYVNGVAEQTKPLPAFTDTDTVDLLLGANGTDGAYLNGMMDEVLLFHRALASNEIAALFAANTAGLCKPGHGSTNQATDFPDLVVAGVTTPDSALMGQSVPIVFTLTNLGRVAAFGPWANQFIIATNAAGLGALTLGSATFLGELAAGSSVTVTQSIIVPAGLVGTRFIGVYADAANNISEVNDNNNLTFVSTAITITAADLAAGNVSAAASAQFGQALNVTFSVTNRGTAGAGASWNDQIYLSAASNSLAGATLLVTVPGAPLDAGAIYWRTQAVTLPLVAGLPAGSYFLVIFANADNAQLESDAGNNLISRAITISYAPLPDLVVGSVTAPWLVVLGSSVPISWTVTNQGTLAARGEWSEVVAISNVFMGALSLAEFHYTNGLDLGQQLVRTETIVVPVSLLAGDWQFIVRTDSRFEVFESNEDNNSTAATNLSQVPATLTLTLPYSALSEGAAMFATLTRNGDSTLPLTVTVTNSNPGELDMTNSVIIPAGQASAAFEIDALLDGVVDGPQVVTLGATATGYPDATASLTVLDVDIPQLTLVFGASTVTEGLSVTVTVSRDYATNLPLFVAVAGFDPTHLIVPNSVTIPANQLSYTFAVLAVDDGQI